MLTRAGELQTTALNAKPDRQQTNQYNGLPRVTQPSTTHQQEKRREREGMEGKGLKVRV